MNSQLIKSMRNALNACEELDRRGFRIQAVEVDGTARLPLVTISEPRLDAVDTYSLYHRNGARTGAAVIAGVSVKWAAPRAARRIA